MKIGLITLISTQNYSKPEINRVQNSTFGALISDLLSFVVNPKVVVTKNLKSRPIFLFFTIIIGHDQF